MSLATGIFPDKLTLAKVSPIHKSVDIKLVNNYRPISVLPTFSKILEKLMYSRLLSYLKYLNRSAVWIQRKTLHLPGNNQFN